MKETVSAEAEYTDSCTETSSLLVNTPNRMSDHEVEICPAYPSRSKSSFDKSEQQLTQQLARLCELMRALKNEQSNRRYEETASCRATNYSSGSGNRSDSHCIFYKGYFSKK